MITKGNIKLQGPLMFEKMKKAILPIIEKNIKPLLRPYLKNPHQKLQSPYIIRTFTRINPRLRSLLFYQ